MHQIVPSPKKKRYDSEKRRKYYQEHREQELSNARKYLEKSGNREKHNQSVQRYYQRLKIVVLSYYSNSPSPKCLMCGESRLPCLSIDHLAGGGKGEGGISFYHRLKREGFPEGYQTLCMNCQFIKKYYLKETKWRNR